MNFEQLPISAIAPTAWTELWNTDYPFMQYAFLSALESSGCTNAATGWEPAHAVLKHNGTLLAAMPLYRKTHSYGEYVFDWAWADAYARAGFNYYPKLLCAAPFTPSTGPRLVYREAQHGAALLQQLAHSSLQNSVSGLHVLFPPNDFSEIGTVIDFIERLGCQFHWFNQDYEDFSAYLASFNSRKRKAANKERQKVASTGIHVQTLLAAELCEDDWIQFHQLYMRTYLKRSGHTGYLNLEFFMSIGREMRQQVALVKASRNGAWVAGALYFFDSTTLYGRYWGTLEDIDGLHYECCYYQGIELAIRLKLQRFDAGAQGEHKIQRGFTPVLTRSLHHVTHPQFHQAIANFVAQENRQTTSYCEAARGYLPFRDGEPVAYAKTLLEQGASP